MAYAAKEERRVFVIMPFTGSDTRNREQLRSFFENNIKRPIEDAGDLQFKYTVYRSGETFDITAEIIRDVCRADIVIADLSGITPNPNVMYELGARLAISDRPVILIRAANEKNERVFDIIGFYTQDYDPLNYPVLESHLVEKISRLETGEEVYVNPVLGIIKSELAKLTPDLTRLSYTQQKELVMAGLSAVDDLLVTAYGPLGGGVLVDGPGGASHLERSGHRIAASQRSPNPIEERGIRLTTQCASEMADDIGDGTKLAVLLGRAVIKSCLDVLDAGATRDELTAGTLGGLDVARNALGEAALTGRENDNAVVTTAAKGELGLIVAEAFAAAGGHGVVTIEDGMAGETTITRQESFRWDTGAASDEFVVECAHGKRVLDDALVLVTPVAIGSMSSLLPVLERVAKGNRPLLIVAESFDDEVLTTLVVNTKQGSLTGIPVRAEGSRGRALGFVRDLSALTGATLASISTDHYLPKPSWLGSDHCTS